jgi:hypothetical protein
MAGRSIVSKEIGEAIQDFDPRWGDEETMARHFSQFNRNAN